ncbi:9276_t:CDS:1, partial [Gigaspora margarita]
SPAKFEATNNMSTEVIIVKTNDSLVETELCSFQLLVNCSYIL